MAGVGADAPVRIGAMFSGRARRYLRRGDVLFGEGAPPEDVFFVHTGLLELTTTGVDGCAALVAFRGAGELLGEHPVFDGGRRLTSAVAVVDTSVSALERDAFREAVGNDHDLSLHLLASFAAHLRASTRHVLELASGKPTALVARRLVELVTDARFASVRTVVAGSSVRIDMPITHDELGSWAGVSRRSVATALGELRATGTISTGRMRIVVHDVAALERLARRELHIGGAGSPAVP